MLTLMLAVQCPSTRKGNPGESKELNPCLSKSKRKELITEEASRFSHTLNYSSKRVRSNRWCFNFEMAGYKLMLYEKWPWFIMVIMKNTTYNNKNPQFILLFLLLLL